MKVVLYASQIPSTGIFQVYLRVMGDNTFVKLMLRVLTRETNLVVFDIDGTLTIGDDELLNHVLNRSYVPREREGAQTLTQIWYNANNEIIYLSGRHYFLTDHSRQWLAQKGFAPGTLIHAQSLSRIWPSKGGVGDYKRSYLQYLQDNGFLIKAAYGNAKTDIYAYEKVNIPKLATFMLGNAGEENEQDMNWIGENFLSHIQKLISGESDVLS